jgi:phosphatidylserine decarboxylase
MKIAKESIPFISINIILLLIFIIFNNISVIFLLFIILCFLLFFFRDPKRIINAEENSFLSAADGKIVEIKEINIDNKIYHKVSVFMSIFNVHINRAPFDGIVNEVVHIPGKFRFANKNLSVEDRERNIIEVKMEDNQYYLKQIAGFVARRTVFYPKTSEKIKKGEKIGIIKFSSRVEHYIPNTFSLCIKIGEKAKAGITVLAKYPKS